MNEAWLHNHVCKFCGRKGPDCRSPLCVYRDEDACLTCLGQNLITHNIKSFAVLNALSKKNIAALEGRKL